MACSNFELLIEMTMTETSAQQLSNDDRAMMLLFVGGPPKVHQGVGFETAFCILQGASH